MRFKFKLKKGGMWSLYAAHFDLSSGIVHKEIIVVVNGGRWFARAVWDGMRRQGRILINFSSSADGGQKSRINHRGQQQSASLLVRTQARCDKLHVSCSIIKQGWRHNQDSTKDICFSLFWPLTSMSFQTSLKMCSANNGLCTLRVWNIWNIIVAMRSTIFFSVEICMSATWMKWMYYCRYNQ